MHHPYVRTGSQFSPELFIHSDWEQRSRRPPGVLWTRLPGTCRLSAPALPRESIIWRSAHKYGL